MKNNGVLIDTGEERNVTGHFISGAIFSSLIAAGVTLEVTRNTPTDKKALLRCTSKAFLQGGLATASAISASNQVGKDDYVGALIAVAVGVGGVYALEKVYQPKSLEDA